MLQTRKISKDLCAVAFEPTEIMLRKSGNQYFGKEKMLVKLKDNKLIFNESVAKEFGIELVDVKGV